MPTLLLACKSNVRSRWEKTPASRCYPVHKLCCFSQITTLLLQHNKSTNAEKYKEKKKPKHAQHRCRLIKRLSVSVCLSQPHLSGSACVMSMRGREAMGRLVGLLWVTGSSSGVSGLPLSFSACRHDNGGSCRLPENRLWTLNTSTPRVLPAENCPTGGSLVSWQKGDNECLALIRNCLRKKKSVRENVKEVKNVHST